MQEIRARSTLFAVVALALWGGSLLILAPPASAATDFWNGPDGWDHRAPVTFTYGGTSTPLAQVPFSLPTASLISAGKLRSDCGDLRIATEAGTILPYWIESGCGGTARVWVRVATLAPGTTTLYAYYGNASATSQSQLNTTFVGNRTWVEQNDCPYGTTVVYCTLTSHADADDYRSFAPACSISRLAVDYGVACTAATTFGTDTRNSFLSEYHFIFVPDVSGTWTFQWIAGSAGELVVNPTDNTLVHGMSTIGPAYGNTTIYQTHNGTRSLTAGVGEFYSFVAVENFGLEGSRINIKRPGGSFLTLNPTNFPGMYFRRTYGTEEAIGALGAEQGLPSQPLSLSATPGPGAGQISVSWAAPATNGGSAITGYHVSIATSPTGPFTLTANVSTKDATLSGLPNNALRYVQVAAYNDRGMGARSAVANATTFGLPSAIGPISLSQGTNRSEALSWSPPSSTGGTPITNYKIYMGTTTSTTYLAQTGGANTSFLVNGLTNGVTYWFNVTAVNLVGEGAAFAPASAVPGEEPYPPAPWWAVRNDSRVELSWLAAVPNGPAVDNYRIYRGTTPGSLALIAETGGANTSFTANGLTNGVVYYFHFTAHNAYGWSNVSAQLSAKPARPPDAPTLDPLIVHNGSIGSQWTPPANTGGEPISYYILYNGTAPGNAQLWGGIGGTSYNWAGVNGQQLCFQVSAVTLAGTGARSVERCATPAGIPYPPVLTIAAGNRTLSASWTTPFDSNSGITGYRLWNGTTVVCSPPVGTTSCVFSGLQNGYTYAHTVTAYNAQGDSTHSNAAIATPRTIPDPPGALAATRGNASIALTWNTPNDWSSGIVDYRVWNGTQLVQVVTAPATGTLVTGLANNVAYTFNVTATNLLGTSSSSNTASATPLTVPDAPGGLVAARGNRSVTLSWARPNDWSSGITNYRVWNGTTILATVSPGVTMHTFAGLANNFTYAFNVTAVNGAGNSASTPLVAATPLTVPNPPGNLSALRGNQSVALTWSIPNAWSSGIGDYRVWNGTELVKIVTAPASGTTIDGLANRVEYLFSVTATNAAGTSSSSGLAGATPISVTNPPGNFSITRGDRNLTLSWTTPNDWGSGVTNIRVWNGTALWLSLPPTQTSALVSSLANGYLYSLNVTAVNSAGESVSSPVVSARPATLPSAPRFLTRTFANEAIDMSWLVPLSNGGEPITGYEAWVGTSPATLAPYAPRFTETSGRINGLTNGVEYFVAVRAVNDVGHGPFTTILNATPARAPDAPVASIATPGSHHVRLEWGPGYDGGSGITNYGIYNRTGPSPVLIQEIGANTTYVVNGLANGYVYQFAIRARNLAGTGNFTPLLEGRPVGPPGAPTLTSATTASTTTTIRVTWSGPTASGGLDILQFRLYGRDTGSPSASLIATVPNTTFVYDDTLSAGASRAYTLSAVNAAGEGVMSAEVTGSRLPSPLDPLPETYRTCTRNAQSGAVACDQGARAGVTAIAAGARHTCALLLDGRVDCWGDNAAGQSGDHVSGRAVVAIAAGASHTCAILDTGNVDCWGSNTAGQATSILDQNASRIAAGGSTTCIVHLDQSAKCRGANGYGQAASRGGGVDSVSVGASHTCFLLLTGVVECHGRNTEGQAVGDATGNVVEVSAGSYHTCVRTATLGVRCRGDIVPAPPALQGQAVALSSGSGFTCALLQNGSVTCWGTPRDDQTRGYAGADAVAIAAGEHYACALRADASVTCWGGSAGSDYGQARPYPTQAEASPPDSTGGAPTAFHVEGIAPAATFALPKDPEA